MDNGASVIVMTHLGCPTEREFHPRRRRCARCRAFGRPVTKRESIERLARKQTYFERGRCRGCCKIKVHQQRREEKRFELGKAYASLCDVFVNDAFGTAHRAQASTEGQPKLLLLFALTY